MLALIKEKSKAHKIKTPEPEHARPAGRNVVDLMDALKKSVKGGASKSAATAPAKRRRGKKAS